MHETSIGIATPFVVPASGLQVAAAKILAALAIFLLGGPTVTIAATAPPDTLSAIRELVSRAKYDEAERSSRRWLAVVEAPPAPDSASIDTCLALLLDALTGSGRRPNPEWIAMARRSIEIGQRLHPAEDPWLGTAWNRLGVFLSDSALTDTALYAPALDAYGRALEIRERSLGPRHPRVAQVLLNLAILHRDRGAWRTARPLFERGLAILDDALGAEFTLVAQSVNSVVDHLWSSGDFASTRPLAERYLGIWERIVGPGHPAVRTSIQAATQMLQGRGNWTEGLPMLRMGLRMFEATMPGHPDVAFCYNGLATLCMGTGQFAVAKELFARSILLWEEALGPDHPDLALGLNNYAELMGIVGDGAAARALRERSLAVRERAYGPDHPLTAIGLHKLAAFLAQTGDYERARSLEERALAIRERRLGPAHPDLESSLQNLAYLDRFDGELDRARLLLERRLRIVEQALGPDELTTAGCLGDLAVVHGEMGHDSLSLELEARSIRIQEQVVGPDNPGLAGDLHDHAVALRGVKRLEESRSLLDRALVLYERSLGSAHPAYASSLAERAELHAATGHPREALEDALEAESIGREHLRLSLLTLPERQALRFAEHRQPGIGLALALACSLAAGDSALTARVWDAEVRSRALVLDEIAARGRTIAEIQDTVVARLAEEFLRARRRLAHVVVRAAGGGRLEHYRSTLDSARAESERAERSLAEVSSAFRDRDRSRKAGLAEVRARLGSRALVAYVRYLPSTTAPVLARIRREAPRGWRYAVFAVRGEGAPTLVDLGDARPIDDMVERWRRLAGDPASEESEFRRCGADLRRLVWDPIASRIGNGAVFLVPDGALQLVNFAALPIGADKYLIDSDRVIHVLTAERDLLDPPATPSGAGMLAMGGADFDVSRPLDSGDEAPARLVATNAAGAERRSISACADFATLRFEPLEAAGREVREVAALWSARQKASSPSVVIAEGARASEAAFTRSAPGRRFVHVATHGFFLDPRCAKTARGKTGARLHDDVENPLLLSGLALAGANRRSRARAGQDDGVLTADEVAALDLTGVERVVLSACETGLGAVVAGEGVFGLRRAFQAAGARSVVMSLWKVGDASAREWMREYYESGLPAGEAAHRASKALLVRRREHGRSTHPNTWAAFIAAGGDS